MLQKLTYNFQIALSSIIQNKLRSFLTSLGIIFGVASVIAMLAIGGGAREEILEQMNVLGTQNLIIMPVVESADDLEDAEGDKGKEVRRWSPGLSLSDAEGIMKVIPSVEVVSPEVVLDYNAVVPGRKLKVKVVGVDLPYFQMSNFSFSEGKGFTQEQIRNSASVCVIGFGVKARLFPSEDPIGKQIKCGATWLTIVGVASDRSLEQSSIGGMEMRNFNLDVYVPIHTVLLRYKNRAKISKSDLDKAAQRRTLSGEENAVVEEALNYHQLDRLVVKMKESRMVKPVGLILERMLYRRHNKKRDFDVIVPEVLLRQEQETTNLFNIVLSSIASISLLVGGIGIMNIMLASVMERIKEIGVRLSLGATKRDIISQFLSEAVTLSISGGLIGILLGIGFGYGIEYFAGIRTIITPFSIILSFFVSITIGLIFGIFPARKAAMQDPVISLRHE